MLRTGLRTRDVGLSQRQRYDSMFWISVWTEEQARIEDCGLGAVRGVLLLEEGRLVDSGKGDVRPVSRLGGVCGIYRLHGMNGYVWLCDLHIWHGASLMPSLAPEVKLRQRGNSGEFVESAATLQVRRAIKI
jgi:hypothetical protein